MIALRRPDFGSASGHHATVRRSIIGLVLTALLAFAVVATGATFVAGHIARRDALDEAMRSATTVGNVVFIPLMPAVMAGEPAATARLDRAVRARIRDGGLVRVKVWTRSGMVVYSDNHDAIGRTFSLHEDVARAIDNQEGSAGLTSLDDPENITEQGIADRLVEVYLPMTLEDGTRLAFEMYTTDDRLQEAERQLTSKLVPFALLALLVLVISQLPVSVWLVRRLGRAQDERTRLLNTALSASDKERRAIARDLHDGVVQDLASAGYVLGALRRQLPVTSDGALMNLAQAADSVVQRSVVALRTLLIDIYPPDLSSVGLPQALHDLAEKVSAEADLEVSVQGALAAELSPEIAATLYRCARECLVNVARHADAAEVTVELSGDPDWVSLSVRDDGVGMATELVAERPAGHFGLAMLQDVATDLGGFFRVESTVGFGTTVVMRLPTVGGGGL